MVVECNHDSHVVKAFGIALVIFYGVDIGVEDVGRFEDFFRRGCQSLHEVVVVGVDACYHVGSYPVAYEVHEYRLFPP